MRFVLYAFGIATAIAPAVRVADALGPAHGPGGWLGRVLDALPEFVVPLGAIAAGVAVGELQRVRAAVERRAGEGALIGQVVKVPTVGSLPPKGDS